MIGVDIKSDGIADALSLANHDAPASDITNTQYQSALADSILDAPIVGNHSDPSWAIDSASDERHEEELYDFEVESEQEAEAQQANEQVDADEIGRRLADEYEHEQILNMAEASLNQPAQPIEWTPEAIHQAVQELDQRIAQENLIDHGASRQHLHDLTEPFGVNPNAVGPGFERAQARAAVSAIASYDAGVRSYNAAALSPAEIELYSEDVFQALGAKPGEASFEQKQNLAAAVRAGDLNIIDAFHTHQRGLQAPAFEINNPELIRQFAAVMGVDETTMRSMAYSRTEFLRAQLRQREANQAQAQPPRQRSTRNNRSGRSASRFRTNSDLYDNEAEALYRQSRGRL